MKDVRFIFRFIFILPMDKMAIDPASSIENIILLPLSFFPYFCQKSLGFNCVGVISGFPIVFH